MPGQDGVSLVLDACGGHSHGDLDYHYHPQVEIDETTTLDGVGGLKGSVEHIAYKGAPLECWAGDIKR